METKQEEKVDETTQAAAPEAGTNTEETKEEVVETKSEETSQDIDYKAANEKLKTKLEAAGNTIQKLKGENKDDKDQTDEGEEILPDSYSKAEIDAMVDTKLAGIQRNIQSGQVREMAYSMAGSPEEAEYMITLYGNVIQPTGDVREDLENAQLIANKKKLATQLTEVQRAANSRGDLSSTGGASQKQSKDDSSALTKDQKELIAQGYGLKPEDFQKK